MRARSLLHGRRGRGRRPKGRRGSGEAGVGEAARAEPRCDAALFRAARRAGVDDRRAVRLAAADAVLEVLQRIVRDVVGRSRRDPTPTCSAAPPSPPGPGRRRAASAATCTWRAARRGAWAARGAGRSPGGRHASHRGLRNFGDVKKELERNRTQHASRVELSSSAESCKSSPARSSSHLPHRALPAQICTEAAPCQDSTFAA